MEMSKEALNFIGPAFEELSDDALMNLDGEWTPLTIPSVVASSPWCITGAAVSVIAYSVWKG